MKYNHGYVGVVWINGKVSWGQRHDSVVGPLGQTDAIFYTLPHLFYSVLFDSIWFEFRLFQRIQCLGQGMNSMQLWRRFGNVDILWMLRNLWPNSIKGSYDVETITASTSLHVTTTITKNNHKNANNNENQNTTANKWKNSNYNCNEEATVKFTILFNVNLYMAECLQNNTNDDYHVAIIILIIKIILIN